MTTADWISLSSVIIALCALIFTMVQMYFSRKHDRLSVMPHLRITLQAKETPPGFEIHLENAGVGPAIIKSFEVILDGHKMDQFEATAWLAIVDLLELKGHVTGMFVDAGEYFQVGKTCVLLCFKSKDAKLTLRQMRQTLQRLEVRIGYSSVYGDYNTALFTVPISIFDCYDTEDNRI